MLNAFVMQCKSLCVYAVGASGTGDADSQPPVARSRKGRHYTPEQLERKRIHSSAYDCARRKALKDGKDEELRAHV